MYTVKRMRTAMNKVVGVVVMYRTRMLASGHGFRNTVILYFYLAFDFFFLFSFLD